MALGLGLLAWIALLFSPLAMVQPVAAEDADNYGTVIGIVRSPPSVSLFTAYYRKHKGVANHDIYVIGPGYHLQLCRCYAKGQGRDSRQRPG